MDCQRFMLSIDDYLEECLDPEDRKAFRGHFQTCAECRREAAAADPTFLLMAGTPVTVDEEAVRECADHVSALIRQDRLRRQLGFRPRHWLAAAAMVVVVLGGGLVWRVAPWDAEPQAPAVTLAETDEGVEGVAPPPTVEVQMPQSDVRIYQFAGSDTETTAVYFVVNEEMEL